MGDFTYSVLPVNLKAEYYSMFDMEGVPGLGGGERASLTFIKHYKPRCFTAELKHPLQAHTTQC